MTTSSHPLPDAPETADILDMRSSGAAYESASSHQGNNRDLAFSVVYLIDMAKAMVERSLRAPQAQANV